MLFQVRYKNCSCYKKERKWEAAVLVFFRFSFPLLVFVSQPFYPSLVQIKVSIVNNRELDATRNYMKNYGQQLEYSSTLNDERWTGTGRSARKISRDSLSICRKHERSWKLAVTRKIEYNYYVGKFFPFGAINDRCLFLFYSLFYSCSIILLNVAFRSCACTGLVWICKIENFARLKAFCEVFLRRLLCKVSFPLQLVSSLNRLIFCKENFVRFCGKEIAINFRLLLWFEMQKLIIVLFIIIIV